MLTSRIIYSVKLAQYFIVANVSIILIHSLMSVFNIENSIIILTPLAVLSLAVLGAGIISKIYEIRIPEQWKMNVPILIYIIAILFITVPVIGLPDFSWDGQAYHLPSIIGLAEGWNPYWSSPTKPIWTDVYPRGFWVLSTVYGTLLGNIESGKIINILLLVCAALIYDDTSIQSSGFIRFIKTLCYLAVLISNVVSQYMTNYADISIYILFVIAVATTVLANRPLTHWSETLPFAALVILMVNTKIAGLFFGFLMMMLYLAALGLQRHPLRRIVQSYVLLGASVVLIGILFIGWRPFITNIQAYGAIDGPTTKITLTTTAPSNLKDDNRLNNIAYSLFGEYRNIEPGTPAPLKAPFTVELSEFWTDPSDPRGGGFGPIFGSVLLLALALRLGCGIVYRLGPNRLDAAAIVLFAACYAMPGSWWARYYPIIFLLPSLFTLRALDTNSRWVGGAALGIVALLGVNFTPTIFYHQIAVTHARAIRAQMASLKQQGVPVAIFRTDKQMDDFNGTPTVWAYRLSHWGVPNRLTTDPADCTETLLDIAGTRLCKSH